MNVIISNGGFLPAKTYGGPVVSIDNLCSFMHDNLSFYVICTNHELYDKIPLEGIKEGWNNRENCYVKYFSDNNINEKSLTRVIEEVSPESIYINSLFDAKWTIPLLKIAKKKKIRVILAPRGQLCKNALIGKYKKLPYIFYLKVAGLINNVIFQSTSDEETQAIKKYLAGKEDRIHYLTNLPSVPDHKLSYGCKEKGKARFVFYSRIVPKKNLTGAIKMFEQIEGKAYFDIYGPIEDEEYWKVCQDKIHELPSNIEVAYKGIINHEDVFDVLSRYDALVFPTWSENFGHVISEALLSGCPVIISNQTPWNNLSENKAGWDIDLKEDEKFVSAIQSVIDFDNDTILEYRKNAELYAKKQFDFNYLKEAYYKAIVG